MRAITTASSAPATDRSMIRPVAFGGVPRPRTCRFRLTLFFPTARSRSAEPGGTPGPDRSRRFISSGSHHERTIRLPAAELRVEVDRTASAYPKPRALVVRGLSDAAQPQLLVDIRRHPLVHAG